MGSNEKFCLRWNDFESNISVAFREIREEKDLFDITLSCGVRQIQAHKLILSACSPFFRSVLKQNPHQHPLLYLKGVKFGDLQAVLNFMYHGEVNVAQEELNSFLSVAEELQVKGLTQNNPPSESKAKPEVSSAPVPRPRPPMRAPEVVPTPKRPRPIMSAPNRPTYVPSPAEDIQEIIPMPVVKTEVEPSTAVSTGHEEEGGMVGTMGTEVTSMEESYAEEGYGDYGGYEGQGYVEGDGQGYDGQEYGADLAAGQEGLSSQVLKAGSGFTCAVCGKVFSGQWNCRRHVKNSHHPDTEVLSCDYCQKSYKNIDSLKDHQRNHHGLYKQ